MLLGLLISGCSSLNQPPAENKAQADADVSRSDAGRVTNVDFEALGDAAMIDWGTTIATPPLPEAISGGDARLVGTWVEPECDPKAAQDNPPFGCVQLTIVDDSAGSFTGTLEIIRSQDSVDFPAPLAGGYPSPDPEVGYPQGVEPAAYWDLLYNLAAGFPYRALDGHFENDQLTFTWSPYDLWHEWCRLQVSYSWIIDDHAFSFCVPQDTDQWAELDEGRIVLCTSAEIQPLCSLPSGEVEPCVCLSGPAERCTPAMCSCDSTGCDADVHSLQFRMTLTLDGDILTGGWIGPGAGDDSWFGQLERQQP